MNAETVSALAIDPSNRWVVTGGDSGQVVLWRLSNFEPQSILDGDYNPVTVLAFSTDGSKMVSAGADGIARVWDLGAPDPAATAHVLRGHEAAINALALKADGSLLATGSDDTSVRVWDLAAPPPSGDSLPKDPAELAQRACAMAGRNLTSAEWHLYFGGKDYRNTCDG